MAVLFLMCLILAAQESPVAKKAEQKEDNISITADSVEMEMEKHLITLDGNVLVADEDMQLSARKMLVYLEENNRIKSIEAVDNVSVRRLKTLESATGDKGFYDASKDVVTLVGNCVINKDKNTANGEKVIYDRKTGTIRLVGAVINIPLVKKDAENAILFNPEPKDEEKKADAPAEKKDAPAESEKGAGEGK